MVCMSQTIQHWTYNPLASRIASWAKPGTGIYAERKIMEKFGEDAGRPAQGSQDQTQTSTDVQQEPRRLRPVVLAAAIGTFVEYYDFAVYGFLASLLATVFFPAGNPTAALLSTFAIFAVAYFVRPLGGLIRGPRLPPTCSQPCSTWMSCRKTCRRR
jgi:hypothetical protein